MKKKLSAVKIVICSILIAILLTVLLAVGYVLKKYGEIVVDPSSTMWVDPSFSPTGGVEDYEIDLSGTYGIFNEGDDNKDIEVVSYNVKQGYMYDEVLKHVNSTFYLYKIDVEKAGTAYIPKNSFVLYIFAKQGITKDSYAVYMIENNEFIELNAEYEDEDGELYMSVNKGGFILVTSEKINDIDNPTPTPNEPKTPDVIQTPDITVPVETGKPTPGTTENPTEKPTDKPTQMPTVKPTTPTTVYNSKGFTTPDFNNSGVTNILLIGIDARENTFSSSRSDVMMILSINEKKKTVCITSIMRDLRVHIAGKNISTKINAAYAYGGPNCLIETIEGHFGLPIDHYVVINFTGTENIIKMLDGVDITITDKEATYLNKDNPHLEFPKTGGTYHFNEKQALAYMRLRHSDNDWFRTQRQGKVLTSLFNEYMNSSLDKILSIANESTKYIRTDMSIDTIFSVLTKVYNCRTSGLNHTSYPIDNGDGSGRTGISGSSDVKEKSYPVQINKLYNRIYDFTPSWR